jgi:transcriptional regulator with XRE-family HTH domain
MLDKRKMKRVRVRNGQTQLDVAIRSGMRPEIYSKIETGQRDNITMDTLDSLAKALKVKPGELLK